MPSHRGPLVSDQGAAQRVAQQLRPLVPDHQLQGMRRVNLLQIIVIIRYLSSQTIQLEVLTELREN